MSRLVFRFALTLPLFAAAALACSAEGPPPAVVGIIDGAVYVTGPVAGAVVTAYPLDLATGALGDAISSSEPTTEDGAYHLEIGATFGPIVLVARGVGASYTESASGVTVAWDSTTELRAAYVRWTPEQTVDFEFERAATVPLFVITPFTDLAFAYAKGRAPGFEDALRQGILRFLDHLELEYWSVLPADLTAGAVGGWNANVQAGLALAGLSQLVLRMANESQISPAGLTTLELHEILVRDIGDAGGLFDGKDGALDLDLGSCASICALGDRTLRAHYAEAIASFLGAARNTSGIGVTDGQALLGRIACRDQPWWPPIQGDCSFDSEGPSITVVGLENGSSYDGDVAVTVTLFDAVEMGAWSATFLRGPNEITDPDFYVMNTANPNKQTRVLDLTIHTDALTDGSATLHVEAADTAGHATVLDLTFFTDNSPLGHVEGTVVAGGRIAGARVTAYEYDDNAKGAALGSAVTDAAGWYSIEVTETTQTALLLEVDNPTGGTAAYAEAASGATINLSTTDRLRSVLTDWFDGAERVDGMVTPWTDVCTAFAHAKFVTTEPPNWPLAVAEAFTIVEEHFADGGPAINFRTVLPADLTTTVGTGTLNSQVRYGLAIAAVSKLAELHAVASGATPASMNTLTLTKKLALDLGDNFTGSELAAPLFDGNMGGVITHGSVVLDAYTTRLEYAIAMASFLASAENATTFTDVSIGALLDAISGDSRAVLYPVGEPGGPYDVVAPMPVAFTAPTPPEGQVLRGALNLRVEASDNHGLATLAWIAPVGVVSFPVDDSAGPLGPWSVMGTLNTDGQPEGALALSAEASDQAGNFTTVTRTIVVDRTNPAVVITSATTPSGALVEGAWTGDAMLTLYGTATDAHLASTTVAVNGGAAAAVTVDAFGNWSVTVTMVNGTNTIVVTSTDAAGNAGNDSASFNRDATAPTVGIVGASCRDDATNTATLLPASGAATSVTYGAGSPFSLSSGLSFVRFASDYGPFSASLPEWHFDVSDNHTADAGIVLEARLKRGATVLVDWASVVSVAGVGYDRSQPLHSGYHVDLARVSGTYTLEYRALDEFGNTSSVGTLTWTQTLRPPPVRQRVETSTCATSEASCPSFYNLDNSLNNTQIAIKGDATLPDGKVWVGAGFVDNPTPVPVRMTFTPSGTSQWRKGSVFGHPRVSDPAAIVTGCDPDGLFDQLLDGTCYAPGSGAEVTTMLASAALVTDVHVVNATSGATIAVCAGCAANEREIPANTTVKVYVRANPFAFVWTPSLTAVTSLGTLPTLSSVTATVGVEWLDCITSTMLPSGEFVCTNQVRRQSVQYLTRVQVTPTVTMTIDAKPASSTETFAAWSAALAGEGTAAGFSYTPFPWNSHETGWPSF